VIWIAEVSVGTEATLAGAPDVAAEPWTWIAWALEPHGVSENEGDPSGFVHLYTSAIAAWGHSKPSISAHATSGSKRPFGAMTIWLRAERRKIAWTSNRAIAFLHRIVGSFDLRWVSA
jgi:hypothetical protein